jgi:hypothetical protein
MSRNLNPLLADTAYIVLGDFPVVS